MLYKYFSNTSDYAFKNLDNGDICFTPIETLNDPLEGIGAYKYTVSKEEQEFWNHIGSDAPKYFETNFVNDVRELLNFKHRIFSTAVEYDNPLLWAHYANSHKGFCVGYEEQDIIDISDCLSSMNYSEHQPSISLDDPKSFEQLLFVKSTHWNYENECRAVYTLKNENEDVQHLSAETYMSYISDPYNSNYKDKIYYLRRDLSTNYSETLCSQKFITKKCIPKSIYFGLNMSPDDCCNLINTVNKPVPHFSQAGEVY